MPEPRPEGRYERRDVDGVHVIRFFVVFFVALALCVVGLMWFFGLFKLIYNPAGQFAESSQIPPPPRIQARPQQEMEMLRLREETILSTYGWTDKTAGTVRIPIDRAVELLLKRGLPVRRGGEVPTAPPYAGAPTTHSGPSPERRQP
ncbi:MAG: hypothetical protein ACM3S5_00840 [Rhodospirillales bacterium]